MHLDMPIVITKKKIKKKNSYTLTVNTFTCHEKIELIFLQSYVLGQLLWTHALELFLIYAFHHLDIKLDVMPSGP